MLEESLTVDGIRYSFRHFAGGEAAVSTYAPGNSGLYGKTLVVPPHHAHAMKAALKQIQKPQDVSIKVVLGDAAVSLHEKGEFDHAVEAYGSIEEFFFRTQAERDAFVLGLQTMEEWFGWTEYNPDFQENGGSNDSVRSIS